MRQHWIGSDAKLAPQLWIIATSVFFMTYIGDYHGRPFFLMELFEGHSLDDRIAGNRACERYHAS
jgi:hypothetical protein